MKKKNRIQEILIKKNISQQELAASLDTSIQAVNRWCRNKYQPDDKYLTKLCQVLRAKKAEIFYLA